MRRSVSVGMRSKPASEEPLRVPAPRLRETHGSLERRGRPHDDDASLVDERRDEVERDRTGRRRTSRGSSMSSATCSGAVPTRARELIEEDLGVGLEMAQEGEHRARAISCGASHVRRAPPRASARISGSHVCPARRSRCPGRSR